MLEGTIAKHFIFDGYIRSTNVDLKGLVVILVRDLVLINRQNGGFNIRRFVFLRSDGFYFV